MEEYDLKRELSKIKSCIILVQDNIANPEGCVNDEIMIDVLELVIDHIDQIKLE